MWVKMSVMVISLEKHAVSIKVSLTFGWIQDQKLSKLVLTGSLQNEMLKRGVKNQHSALIKLIFGHLVEQYH